MYNNINWMVEESRFKQLCGVNLSTVLVCSVRLEFTRW